MLKTSYSVEDIARETKNFLSKYIRVDRIILFGSYLRGDFREDSDIDMAVISEDLEKMSVWEKIELLAKVPIYVDSRVEIIGFSKKDFLNPDKRSLLYIVKNEGKILF